MKKLLLNTLFIIISFTCFSQDAVIAIPRENILYMGLINYIEVVVPNASSDKINISADNEATIKKIKDGSYEIYVLKPGLLTIVVEVNGKITKKKFRVKPIPDPVAQLPIGGSNKKDSIPYMIFKEITGIIAEIMNFDIDARCSITSYTIDIIYRTGETRRIENIGCCFTNDTQNIIANLKPNNKIFFTNIKAKCPGDLVARDLNPLTVTLK